MSYFDLVEVAKTISLEERAMAEFISAQLDHQRNECAAEPERLWVATDAAKAAKEAEDSVKKELMQLLNMHIIEHVDSAYSSPILPVLKWDSSLRLCVDYRKLN